MASPTIKSALESLLFVWGQPLEAKAVAELFGISVQEANEAFLELKKEYEERHGGLIIRQADKSYQLATNPENDDYICRMCTPAKEKRLSLAALEVLAVIAYKQPVTKGEIDAIRGIKSDRVIEGLLKKELIEERGRSSCIGRPILYGTTRNFLTLFGYSSLSELPELDDIEYLFPEEGSDDPAVFGQMSMLDAADGDEI